MDRAQESSRGPWDAEREDDDVDAIERGRHVIQIGRVTRALLEVLVFDRDRLRGAGEGADAVAAVQRVAQAGKADAAAARR